jgi:hypothetical protein
LSFSLLLIDELCIRARQNPQWACASELKKRSRCPPLVKTESLRGAVNARVTAAEETVAQHASDKQKDHDGQKHDKKKFDKTRSE